ncbi:MULTISPECIES: serine hydrolase domain-containing protein [unclassified Streptomyces]|uniref:serine hydrolase domain-containing protein n=1 Tax=unclassified Streptomyces TaxID=2593676 RepID=UPI0006F45C46|nr:MULTISPECIES: serine hydrolase domain-containing protein [unclassified Streptomyces]KQX50797.1 serine hydrolase [Streptomyces sp. Root1304]KRA84962.1 serine hydrolase [Streptomyces sp. Root66D1]
MRCSRTCRRRVCAGVAGIAALGIFAAPAGAGTAFAADPPVPAPFAAPAAPSASASARSDFPELTPAVAARLDQAIQDVQKEAGVPGVTVALSAPGKGTYIRSFGVADTETHRPMESGLYMRIGSETKTFTVTALLQLVDRGKVGLDDPISRYVDGVPNGDKITLRQLAAMRSGLFNYTADEDFFKALTTNPERSFTPQELLDYAFEHPVQFQPGAGFEYSNTNTVVLGLVVEKVGGMPLQDFIRKNIVGPTGMSRTSFPTDAAFPSPHTHGYTEQTASGQLEDATDWNPSWGWAAGAMISDLQDLRTWARVVATGTLLTPKTQAERLRVYPGDTPGSGYGLGIFDIQGWIGHNGSLPGYQSLTVYLPEAKATLVILLNTDVTHEGSAPSTLFGKAVTQIVTPDHVYDIPVPAAPPSEDPGAE